MDSLSVISLFVILILRNCICDTFYIDSTGTAGVDCTVNSTPCPTISEVLVKEIKGRRTLILCGNYTINESLTLSGTNFVVKSNDSESYNISLDDTSITGDYIFAINSATSYSSLNFVLSNSTVTKESVFYINGSRVSFEDIMFNSSVDNNYVEVRGLIFGNGGELTLNKCQFKFLKSIGNLSVVTCINTDLTITSTTFLNCRHEGTTDISLDHDQANYGFGNAGGCIYHQTNINGVDINIGSNDKPVSIKNCYAEWGGAIYFSLKKNPEYILVTDIGADNNTAGTMLSSDGVTTIRKGDNIFIDRVTTYLVNLDNFPFFGGREESDDKSMGNKDGNVIKLITFANKYKDNLYVGDAGNENNDCNSTEQLCRYLANIEPFINYARNVYIVDKYAMFLSWPVNSEDLTLRGLDDTCILYANGSCSFDINALKITNLNLVFTEEFANSNMDYFLYVMKGGTLEMSSGTVSVSSPQVKIPNVIVSLDSASLIVDSCTFTGIVSLGSAGSIVSGEGTTVFMYGCSYDGCSCENGDGGVLDVNFKESLIFGRANFETSFKRNKATRGGAIFLSPDGCDSYILTDLTFGKGEEENDATSGKNLFIISKTFNITCNTARLPTLSNEEAGGHFFEGVEEDGDDPRDIIDLMNGKYKEGPKMIYFSDNDDCNITDSDGEYKTCNTDPDTTSGLTRIAYEINRVKYSSVNITIVESWAPILNYTWSGNGYLIYGNTHDSQFVINKDIFFTIETDAEFRNLTMTLASDLRGNIFEATFGELILYFVTVRPADNKLSTVDGSVFHLERFADSQFESVILINITTTANGNVIHATVGNGKQMQMTGVDYTNGVTLGDYGGALYVDVEDGGYFYFIKSGSSVSTVTGCQSQSKGGAIYMVLHTDPLSITFTDVIFGTEGVDLNYAPNGGHNLYIIADQLEEALMTASFTISSDYGLMQRIVFEDLESEHTYALTDVFPDYSSNLYLSGEINESEVFCGAITTPCVSLNRAYKKSSGSRKELCIIANITHNEEITCNKECTLIGYNKTSGIICEKGSEFLIIKDLNISSLIFSLKSIQGTLMKVTKCTYTATCLTFTPAEGLESITLNSPLITISERGRGVITACIFNGITATNSDGSAINTYLSISTSLYIKGCSFINCKTTGGNGGALFVNVSDDSSIILQSDGTNPCVFKKCSASKVESKKSKFLLLNNEVEKGDTTTEQPVVETGRGGGFYLRFGSLPNYILIEDVVFGEGDEANSGEGRDFFIESVTIEEVVTADRFPILSSLPKDYDGGKAMSTGAAEAKNARSLVKTDESNNMMMIIIIASVVVVVVVVLVVVIIICLKKRK